MTTTPESKLERVGSHFLTLGMGGKVEKEECFGYFRTEWRGQPATITMHADRYAGGMDRHNLTMGEWRIIGREARAYDPEKNGGRGPELTETARQRLSEQNRSAMAAWIDSDDYRASRHAALLHAILRETDGMARSGTAAVERAIAANRDDLTAEDVTNLETVCTAWTVFEAAKARVTA